MNLKWGKDLYFFKYNVCKSKLNFENMVFI